MRIPFNPSPDSAPITHFQPFNPAHCRGGIAPGGFEFSRVFNINGQVCLVGLKSIYNTLGVIIDPGTPIPSGDLFTEGD
ncbi:hypothetical protein BA171_03320 [Candidatus Hamiltonella defensa (Bemisia tabaci)]|uniref:Uncharacterized protein n=1 Tax=Candidatus Hamiltonella defensa (Bemisia tabaci) TaxID=672795 RepID=A0A249DX75_9ENTR|nr:hypothetical protein BA171_03320 [Candidatus Hamiltonella defensa (Bemisia tabaci)]